MSPKIALEPEFGAWPGRRARAEAHLRRGGGVRARRSVGFGSPAVEDGNLPWTVRAGDNGDRDISAAIVGAVSDPGIFPEGHA